MKNTIILIAIILFSININSQNLVGAWERTQKNELGTMEKQIVIFSSNGFQSISIFNAESGEFIYTNGGTWELSGDDLTEKYSDGKSVKDLQNFSEQKDGKEYKYEWWMDGMRRFLNSPDSKPVQDKTIYEKFSRKFNRSKYGNVLTKWSTPREFAIGMAAQNSANRCLLRGRNGDWDAEELMKDFHIFKINFSETSKPLS